MEKSTVALIDDLYELKHICKDFDQKPMENVYYFRQRADPFGGPYSTQSERLARDWMLDVLPALIAQLPPSYVTIGVKVRSLVDPDDKATVETSQAGTRATATEYQPSFVAGKIALSHDKPSIKKGRKMLTGTLEGDQNTGIFTATGLAVLAARAAAMVLGTSTLLGGAKAFVPVIVKRVVELIEGKKVYRLPNTRAEQVWGDIKAAVPSQLVTAQDTRKR